MNRRRFLVTLRAGALSARFAAGVQPRWPSARTMAILLAALFLLAVTHAGPAAARDRHSAQRAHMVAEIAAIARETGDATGRPISAGL
jgi:hypothetical protein